ncbi:MULTISPECIES: hypothetical protein [Asticcacaulis]|uniref:hypothetical protein n=1 Tax=Asticcacaulis TaxID=76890 RepID=UPI001AE7DF13|nr:MULTISPECIES: hypothetical protein [Asticcacaulis]MBP2157856.1 hypothetical protein [Asticcacaulis solisilvae]MDR6798901.1 hypothetical protein [Asticcacaulis sp. BE141]
MITLFPAALLAAALVTAPPAIETPAAESSETPMAIEDLDATAAQGVEINTISDQDLNAVNSGNTIVANTLTNGDISFSAGALSGFSGVGNFVTNTGNNSNLQGSISVTITNSADLPSLP